MAQLRRRLYKLSLASGLFMAAPLLFGTIWYAWSAYATLDRYRREFDKKQPVDSELFQIALHDQLLADLRRLQLAERPSHGGLPTFSLSLTRSKLDALSDPHPKEGANRWVKALLAKDDRVHDVEVRQRGDQPWHRLGQQKSLKVQLAKAGLIDGVRVFNLLNDPTAFGLEDQLILDLAREQGLLTPDYHPVWLRLNNHDMGVYRFEAQPDETLLRRGHRMPGNMYSGDADEAGLPVFSSTVGWQKIASRIGDQQDQAELDRLVAAVSGSSHREFAAYAEEELDLDRYALFDALDVVFGGSEHDWFSNHKFYADPYRGRLEPVAWSFRGFQHEHAFNVIDHPLLIRLKMTPGYLARRDRKVYELLTGKASVPSIRERADGAIASLTSELAADPYWDAYKQLPRVSRFHRFYVRPMTLDRWLLSAADELDLFALRSRWLLDQLEEPGLEVRRSHLDGAVRIDLVISAHAAYVLGSVRAEGGCSGALALHADADLDGRFDPALDPMIARVPFGESAEVKSHRELAPRTLLSPHPDPKPKRGLVRAETEPTTFTFFATAVGCDPTQAALLLQSAVIGSTMRIDLGGPAEPVKVVGTSSVGADTVPRWIAGVRGAHPWSFPERPVPVRIALGPGKVSFDQSHTFAENETVDIAPGTTLLLAAESSLIFRGPLFARGTAGRPIQIVRLDPYAPFGGIALQGPGTAGSRLSEVRIEGGSRIRGEKIDYSGALNLHDTSDIRITELAISGDVESGDVIHCNRVDGLSLEEVAIKDAPTDAIDLEFVSTDIRGLSVIGAGDDCLDLMGSTVRLQDSLLSGCKNNGVSAGEESDLTANRVVIARAKTGIFAKNASSARVIRSLLYQVEKGLRARSRQERYDGPSRIGTSEVFVVGAEVIHDADRGSMIELGTIHDEMPEENDLRQIQDQVLRISDWSQLDRVLEGGAP